MIKKGKEKYRVSIRLEPAIEKMLKKYIGAGYSKKEIINDALESFLTDKIEK